MEWLACLICFVVGVIIGYVSRRSNGVIHVIKGEKKDIYRFELNSLKDLETKSHILMKVQRDK